MRTSKKILGSEILCEYDSTNIKKAKYEINNRELDITFNNGSQYRYFDVPHDLFTEFDMAESQGKTFSSKIRSLKYQKL